MRRQASVHRFKGFSTAMPSSKILKTAYLLAAIPFHLMLTGCIGGYLSVHTDYLSEESLASYYVNTPDPRRWCPSVGQRLIISWTVPQQFLCYDDLHIDIALRYRNKESARQQIAITKKSGTYLISIVDDDFFRTGGILTYKIDLIGNDALLEEWRHQIWADIIELKPLEPSDESTDVWDDFDWDGEEQKKAE